MLCCYWGQVLSGSLLGRDGYKSSWPFDYLIFSLFFCNWKLHFIWNPFYNYFRVIRLLRIDFTSNHFLTASSDKSIRFFAIFVFPPFWFFNDIFHQILCSLHASAPSGNWMSNLRNETKILHLPKAQRNQALAAFVNLNRLNENHFDSGLSKMYHTSRNIQKWSEFPPIDFCTGICVCAGWGQIYPPTPWWNRVKYLSSKSQSIFQPPDNNQSSVSKFVFKTFLALDSDEKVPFPKHCKWDDFEVLEYGSPHVVIFKIVGIFLSGGQFSHVVVPNYPVARVWTFWIKMSRLEIFL